MIKLLVGFGAVGLVFLIGIGSEKSHVIGQYVTSFEDRLSAQTKNAQLAAKRLNGTIVPAGGMLSFNKIVGSWSRDQGYKRAPVSFSGTLVPAFGGGVCQTSTTLYNACLLAGMTVIERHRHHFAANYVPPGRDAAVAFPNIDLKLKNNSKSPLKIVCDFNDQHLVVKILSRMEQKNTVIREVVSQVKSPSSIQIGFGNIGRIRNPGKTGYQVQIIREIDGVREMISEDSYPVMNRVVERVPGN